MNLIFRLIGLLLTVFFRSKLDLLGESRINVQVWPNDLDIYGHMNNGRYLTIMDLGRFDLLVRTGLLKISARHRWKPLVGSVTIRFRRSLDPFQKYELCTRILCWDEKWFFMEQRFERNGNVFALAIVKGLFRGSAGNVPIRPALGELGYTKPSPSIPAAIQLWIHAENQL